MYATGSNARGQLGIGGSSESLAPAKIAFPGATKIYTVSCGLEHTLAVSCTSEVGMLPSLVLFVR